MEEALRTLGYRVFAGMGHNYLHDNQWPEWTKAIEARYYGKGRAYQRDDFEKFLGQYDAVGGWFAALLAEDLLAAYPEAKVIITTRDPDVWVESWDSSVVYTHKWWRKWWWILPLCGGKERDFRRNAELSLHAWSYGNPFDRVEQRKIYVHHNERIRKLVPEDGLLDIDANAEWKPLCQFLAKEVPEGKSYPHAANRRFFHAAMTFIWQGALLKALVRVAVSVGLTLLTVILLLRKSRCKAITQQIRFFLQRGPSRQ